MKNLTLRLSTDKDKTWTRGRVIYPRSEACSALTTLKNGKVGILFEKDDYSEIVFVTVSIKKNRPFTVEKAGLCYQSQSDDLVHYKMIYEKLHHTVRVDSRMPLVGTHLHLEMFACPLKRGNKLV